jgi:hypothetical protein
MERPANPFAVESESPEPIRGIGSLSRSVQGSSCGLTRSSLQCHLSS